MVKLNYIRHKQKVCLAGNEDNKNVNNSVYIVASSGGNKLLVVLLGQFYFFRVKLKSFYLGIHKYISEFVQDGGAKTFHKLKWKIAVKSAY